MSRDNPTNRITPIGVNTRGSPWERVNALALKAINAGATIVNPSRIDWDISGNCQSPYTAEIWGRPNAATHVINGVLVYDKFIIGGRGKRTKLSINLSTRCRRCATCRRVRHNLWWHRAKWETTIAPRTWFGTLTLRPAAYNHALAQARLKDAKNGDDFEARSPDEQFALIHAQISPELTRTLKRVRKACNHTRLRFILVCEAHKSGVPHYHLLIHETDPDNPVTWRQLDKGWRYGFSKWKLVTDPSEVGYVTKYLTKSALARVRASERYGETPLVKPVSNDSNPRYVDIMTAEKNLVSLSALS